MTRPTWESSVEIDGRRSGSSHGVAWSTNLVALLVESAIIHPEEWDNLPQETRTRLSAQGDRDILLQELSELSLLNAYQADRIKAGTHQTLVLGNYRVLGPMGAGGNGVVFEADHLLMRRKVALKVFPVTPEHTPTLITRFLREMRAVARLDHPNIVAAFDAGICPAAQDGQPDLYYFAMEHLTGQDLEQHLHEHTLRISEACTLIYQIASALDEAHRHHLVHRDIKPSNIFLTSHRQAKLLDFGLVRHSFGNALTMPDTVIGTLDYMAPEQAGNPTKVDIRSAIFGLGACLFFALTGKAPFPSTATRLDSRVPCRQRAALDIRSLRSDIPAGLADILDSMLAADPDNRLSTPQAVMHALLPYLESPNFDRSAPTNAEAATEPAVPSKGAFVKNPPRVLVVDADAAARAARVQSLSAAGFQCLEAESADGLPRLIHEDRTEAVLLSVNLPGAGGAAVLQRLRDNPPCSNLKVLFTAQAFAAEEMAALLRAGADDYLSQPISTVQLVARVRAALKHKEVQDRIDLLSRQLLDMNTELEQSLNARTSDLVQARNALVLALARLVEYRSTETHAHLTRMQRYAVTLGQEAAGIPACADQIDPDFIQMLECCAPLHDIGNASLPDAILLKVGRLDPHESQAMRSHTVIGADTLQIVARNFGPKVAFLGMAIDIARHHHEHFDGSGYPDHLAGNAIPLSARIIAVADAYDGLRSRRPHRPALSHSAALQLLRENSPGKFDPLLLGALQRCGSQFDRIFRELPDSTTVD